MPGICPKIIQVPKRNSHLQYRKLFQPETYDKIYFQAFIDGESGKQINFERIKIVKPDGTKVVKWSFKGRIMIESKYAGQKES